jgi:chemotaxis signal transduction protein
MTGERVLLVRVGTERFALPLAEVIEAVDSPALDGLALAPAGVVGQCVHRGRLLTVFDAGMLLGVPRSGGAGALLVIDAEGERAAVLVDDVLDAELAHPSMRRAVPATGAASAGYLAGVLALPSGLAALVDLGTLRATILSRLTSEVG